VLHLPRPGHEPNQIQRDEADYVHKTTGVGDDDLQLHDSGDVVSVGAIDIELIHTPGHTPGSQCFLVANRLVAGDTLFLDGCGRTDLPGSDSREMYYSLTQRLAKVPDEAVLYPGHLYSAEPSAPMGETRQNNFVFRPRNVEQWMAMFSYPNGAYAVVSQTLAAFEHHQTVKVTGTKGAMWAGWSGVMDRTFEPTSFLKLFDGTTLQEVKIEKHAGEVYELRTQIERCVQMVRGGATPLASGNDGLWSTALCLIAEESIRQKRALRIADFMS
jgi:glyoxylase-like metal-dependent hydrolase (beta-lactamase superfamily II)